MKIGQREKYMDKKVCPRCKEKKVCVCVCVSERVRDNEILRENDGDSHRE